MNTLRRTIHPEVRVIDEKLGIAEFIASDETIDSYREVIRAEGWKFNRVQKNFPFVDSHDYSTIEKCLGRVIDFGVRAKLLMNTVQYAIGVQENRLAQLGWKMLVAKMLPAVSVGFIPTLYATKWDSDPAAFNSQLAELSLDKNSGVTCVYVQQEQIELSQCVIGANPNAVARSYKLGALDDADLDFLTSELAKRETANSTDGPAAVELARQRARTAFLMRYTSAIKKM